jgi:hypothetical protein
MDKELSVAGDRMWEAIDPEAREDFSVLAASSDTLTCEVLALFMKWDPDEPFARDVCLDALEEHLVAKYDIPRDRCDEVFSTTQAMIRDKAANDGEA